MADRDCVATGAMQQSSRVPGNVMNKVCARRIRALSPILIVHALLSCGEPLTVQRPQQAERLEPIAAPKPTASVTYESMGTYGLGVTTQYNPAKSVAGPTTPGNKKRLVRITASGRMFTMRSIYWTNDPAKQIPTPDSYGPSGFANLSNCYINLFVSSTAFYGGETWYAPSCTGGSASDTLVQGYAILAGASTINRAAGFLTGSTDCYNPQHGYGPCNTYADSGQAVTIERVIPDFTVSFSPDTANWNDTVTVSVSVSPDTLGTKEVPWTVDSTRWVPAFGSQTSPCAWNNFVPNNSGNPRVCRKPFTRSGTLTVFATVNGDPRSQAVPIAVRRPQLSLTAVPNQILAGDSVVFTASVSPTAAPWNIQSWEWTPNSGSGGLSQACAWNNNPCRRTVSKSGTMKVRATVDSKLDSATAAVTVVVPELLLRPAEDDPTYGDTIVWTAEANPPVVNGHVIDVTISSWAWAPFAPSIRSARVLVPFANRGRVIPTPTRASRIKGRASAGRPVFAIVANPSSCSSTTDTVCVSPQLEDGDMRVIATVNGKLDTAFSEINVKPKLVVTCDSAAVKRGNSIRCVATALGANGPPQINNWSFDPFEPGYPTIPDDRPVSDTVWAGVMALGGVVHVTGAAGGENADPGIDTVLVNARDWSAMKPSHTATEDYSSPLPNPPTQAHHLGDTGFGVVSDSTISPRIPTGPNNGFYYMNQMHVEEARIRVNYAAFLPNSAFVNSHPLTRGSFCSRTDVQTWADSVKKHEGTTFQVNSHTYLYREKMNQLQSGPLVEPLVGASGPVATTAIRMATQALYNQAYSYATQADSNLYNLNTVCNLNLP